MGIEKFHKYSEENKRATEITQNVINEQVGHNITVSSVEFTDSFTKRAGAYYSDKKQIRLSIHYLNEYSWDEVTDTIKHEVAHAAAHQIHNHVGHGKPFKLWASKLDAPRHCKKIKSTDRYAYRCPTCGTEWRRKRQTDLDERYCSQCAAKYGYNNETRLTEIKL